MCAGRAAARLASVLAVLGGATPPVESTEARRPVVLELAWYDPTGSAPGIGWIGRSEATHLLARMGVTARWRVGRTGDLARPGEVVVVLLERKRPEPEDHVLGASQLFPRACPTAWIHLPSVQQTLGMRLAPWWALEPGERQTLGIAVGRVAVHEVVHAAAPEVPHGRALMATTFCSRLLTGRAPRIDRDVAQAVQLAVEARGAPDSLVAFRERRPIEALAGGPDEPAP